ncbi:DUF2085 domain-containing protein [Candidatus Micrarchaeota archaeon]|nr:DUF2085 domain-containing protein [Candidatus Micrarchaeota archaeon]
MNRNEAVYFIYTLFFSLLVGLIVLTPFWAFENDSNALYDAFRLTCHQKLSRSLCLFNEGSGYSIADCIEQTGMYIPGDQDQIMVEKDGKTGYKLPVCARDVGLYGAMLIGALVYPLIRRLDDKSVYPGIYLVIAMIPIGLDGGLQIISDFLLSTGTDSFLYESTNFGRLVTGGIAGFVASVYAIPILINMFSKD